ncbi:AraC family transcriptional regulator [Niallia circulans]|jgi:AraC family transcriptional regulator, arabinose operon regulatory protein|uniref:helix-turn-helix transcriptional regulator n=1 Tax=Shouchella clausii TaxID=79880 RepID=UPI000D9C0868|nr:AraC family transcriptional regulator [Shouchella clausii]MCM3550620.1 AraC family transcriptional regulator [Shouchella clausii]SPU22515.1 AraC family transcriptional regulator [Niallia circulans]
MFLVDYCDYSCYNRDNDRIYRPNGLGFYLFLRFYKPMKIVLNHSTVFSRPGACLLYTPEQPQDYVAIREFQNSYVHFSVEHSFLSDYQLPQNEIFYPHNLKEIDQLFCKLQAEFLSQSKLKLEMMDALLRQLFVECSRQLEPTHPLEELGAVYPTFRKLRLMLLMQCEKNWSVAELCRSVHLEKSQFYTYYEQFFYISPKADLLNARMNKAKQMLKNKAAMIQDVAESCGFSSASHFSRQFKRHTGLSPKEYRENQLRATSNPDPSP